MTHVGEHDYEPVPGLPAALPRGERLLWQGAPTAPRLAREAFRVRGVGLYFAALLAWRGAEAALDGAGAGTLAAALAPVFAMGALALLLLVGLAALNARCTLYTITNRRVVMRFGVALPMTVNIPFSQLQGADLRLHADGSGDLALSLTPGARVSYLVFWPHVRPWHFSRVQPTLRAIADPARAASLLQAAVADLDAAGVLARVPAPEQEFADAGILLPSEAA